MKTTMYATAIAGAFLSAPAAIAGNVWLAGWDNEALTTRLLGFDEETGELRHAVAGDAIVAADVCHKTGTVYFLDMTTLKAIEPDGTVKVIEEHIGENFSGVAKVMVGQRYCTVWAFALWNQEMHIIRNPGKDTQERIDTAAFDYVAAADVDDSNDDLWIGQANGRVYRVSKKTGLRSYRIEPVGGEIRSIAVSDGIMHVLRWDGLTGYANTTTRAEPQQLYFDTGYQQLFDSSAYISLARVITNGLGEPVVNALDLHVIGGYRTDSEVLRMEMDLENGTVVGTNDYFVPFEDYQGIQRSHGEPVAADGRNLWMANYERLRLVDPVGVTLREIDIRRDYPGFDAYHIAY